jgi:hypothetical protein
VLHLVYESTPHNKQLQRTVTNKLPEVKRGRPAAELRRYAALELIR